MECFSRWRDLWLIWIRAHRLNVILKNFEHNKQATTQNHQQHNHSRILSPFSLLPKPTLIFFFASGMSPVSRQTICENGIRRFVFDKVSLSTVMPLLPVVYVDVLTQTCLQTVISPWIVNERWEARKRTFSAIISIIFRSFCLLLHSLYLLPFSCWCTPCSNTRFFSRNKFLMLKSII